MLTAAPRVGAIAFERAVHQVRPALGQHQHLALRVRRQRRHHGVRDEGRARREAAHVADHADDVDAAAEDVALLAVGGVLARELGGHDLGRGRRVRRAPPADGLVGVDDRPQEPLEDVRQAVLAAHGGAEAERVAAVEAVQRAREHLGAGVVALVDHHRAEAVEVVLPAAGEALQHADDDVLPLHVAHGALQPADARAGQELRDALHPLVHQEGLVDDHQRADAQPTEDVQRHHGLAVAAGHVDDAAAAEGITRGAQVRVHRLELRLAQAADDAPRIRVVGAASDAIIQRLVLDRGAVPRQPQVLGDVQLGDALLVHGVGARRDVGDGGRNARSDGGAAPQRVEERPGAGGLLEAVAASRQAGDGAGRCVREAAAVAYGQDNALLLIGRSRSRSRSRLLLGRRSSHCR